MTRTIQGIILASMLMTFIGCETARYTADQTFSMRNENQLFDTTPKPQQSNSALASVDSWMRRNLW